MNPKRLIASRCFPALISVVDDLIELSARVEARGLAVGDQLNNPNDRVAAMVFSYFARQREHLVSVRILTISGQHRDAGLVARTMLEGSGQLSWAVMNQPEGPDEWYWFSVVEEWRILRKSGTNSLGASDDSLPEFEQLRALHGPKYYSGKAKKNLSEGKSLPDDPYRREWHKFDIASLFAHIGAEDVYNSYYRPTSSWAHWNPNQILGNLVEYGDRERYETDDPQSAVLALAAAVAAFIDVLEITVWRFRVPMGEQLDEITGRFRTLTDYVKESQE